MVDRRLKPKIQAVARVRDDDFGRPITVAFAIALWIEITVCDFDPGVFARDALQVLFDAVGELL